MSNTNLLIATSVLKELRLKRRDYFTSTSATERFVLSTNNQPMKLPALSIASTCTSTYNICTKNTMITQMLKTSLSRQNQYISNYILFSFEILFHFTPHSMVVYLSLHTEIFGKTQSFITARLSFGSNNPL